MPVLFTPITLRGLSLKNRIVISPMCQYSAVDGKVNDWHLVQYGRFAVGGAGMVILEATAVTAQGRITPGDLGLWGDDQVEGIARISDFLKANGSVPAIQLGHAGRKAATARPWHGNLPLGDRDVTERGEGAWPIVAPSAEAMADGWPVPASLDLAGIETVRAAFTAAARRALRAGIEVVEIHCAHGYLLHAFLSPLSNHRTDVYGGSREGRMRLPLEIASDIRALWPQDRPVFLRVSAVDNLDGGLELEDTIVFAQALKQIGIDVIDCSSGGIAGGATAGRLPRGPGFQIPFAATIREKADIATMAVGLILDARHAEAALVNGETDLIAIGRAALDNPNWPLHARALLCGEDYADWPPQHGWWLERRAAIMRAIRDQS